MNKTRKLILVRVKANKQFYKQNRNHCKYFSFYEKTCIFITKLKKAVWVFGQTDVNEFIMWWKGIQGHLIIRINRFTVLL